ncbi:cation/H+ exchanger 4 [Hibiscus trionum]|uniref:Cation/H+ exchanger 4 n=1 Tax=Hibiscus trionum TaxID=183268 RepID=A0A9W7IMC9_HIBTR|nr:cation/H+ exchanger 4 [Hibiscus trionum]
MATGSSSSYSTGIDGTKVSEEICLKFPPKVTSPGLTTMLFETDEHDKLMDYAGIRLHLQMVVIYVLTQSFHRLLKILGLPVFISQVLAGIMLTPMVFRDQDSLINVSEDSVAILGTVGAFGFVFFMFLSGVKMDITLANRSGKKAVFIGFLTVVVPMMFCLATVKLLHPGGDIFKNKSFFLAVSYAGTSFPVIHCLLDELKILNSELGRIGLSAALIGDLVTVGLTMFSILVKTGLEQGRKRVLIHIGLAVLFILIVMFVLRPGMKWIVKRTPEAGRIKEACFYLVVLAFMVSPRFTELFHLHILYGPFILGLAVPDGPPLGSALIEKLEPFVLGLFLPVFAATCGLRFNLSYLKNSNEFADHQAIGAVVALVTKFGVSFVLPRLFKMPTRDCLALAFIMVSKGIVEIGSYSIMHDNRSISEDIFSYMTILIVLVASIVPVFVKRLYDPSRKYLCFQKRTVASSKLDHELRMISCIHVPANVNSIINLLKASCPTKECPIQMDVLHLVKLRGQATPLFITHRNHKKTKSNRSYSDNVVVAFKQFERDYSEGVSVNVFTAVSPPHSMYEDICNLAMNCSTSFIILPFHRRWYTDGSIESEDETVRSLNFDILEKAPCSVGILVEGRRNLRSSNLRDTLSSSNNSPTFNIAVIFLGGRDDWEAIAIGKRISQDESVTLTVIHLKAANNLGMILADTGTDDRTLDNEMLSHIKGSVDSYIEEQVNDGPETSNFLRAVVGNYQLIIVGRRYNSDDPQTSGLQEWCEFQEIGVIGDLLSSPDFIGNYSLLIVQQQQQRTA